MFDERTLLVRKNHWWHVPSLLGLDSVTVVLSWLWLTAQVFEKTVPISVYTVVFCAVWVIYLTDRLADVRTCRDWENATARLNFGRRFRPFFVGALVTVIIGGLWLIFSGKIPGDVLKRFVAIGLGMVFYFFVFVWPPCFRKKKWPGKEFGVGLFFAAGIFVATGFDHKMLPAFVGMAILITFNCLLIAASERDEDAANDPGAASVWWPTIQRDLFFMGLVLTAVSLVGVFVGSPAEVIFGCLSISFVAMTLLHRNSQRFSGATTRAFADFCLLSPLLFVWT